jgi:hypothetical protein
MASKNTQTLTIAEAIEQGYTYFVESGEDKLFHLSDFASKTLDDINPNSNYWLLSKESSCFQLGDTDIAEALCDLVDNQDEFNDEDMELNGYVNDLQKEQPELFTQLQEALNKKFESLKFHPPTNIELIFPR